ncbi:unnamed protein product [Didymodactylos carnosus]|uniref:Uncharacterized protein n=1 Tax=Didymodactylos carnosus TaxID=1234261 RepID=A0A8S2XUP7_9BILA|nr:unnamed protein product [Didymodactylos carnosus]CAF4512617.1 unnamed protein product [Didymodactylos carnosus]
MSLALATLTTRELTTAVYLNISSEIKNYPELRYLSYPRSSSLTSIHFYMSHEIHSSPGFDHVIHTTIDTKSCECSSATGKCDEIQQIIRTPGIEWLFSSIPNKLDYRLMPDSVVRGKILTIYNTEIECKITVLESIHCVIGPAFGKSC